MAVLMMATAKYHGVPLRSTLMEIMIHMGIVVLNVLLLLVGSCQVKFYSSLYIHKIGLICDSAVIIF